MTYLNLQFPTKIPSNAASSPRAPYKLNGIMVTPFLVVYRTTLDRGCKSRAVGWKRSTNLEGELGDSEHGLTKGSLSSFTRRD